FNIDSSNIYTRHNLVYIARFTGNYKRAVEVSTDESIENTPMKAFSYNNRGYAKMKLGDLEGAEKDMMLSRKLDPKNSYVYYNLGLLYLEKKNKTQACAYFQQALALDFTKMYGNDVQKMIDLHCK
ncbi:MAG: tetratricopeptide repeat protein, partial [Bacteroidia bacterium]